jgi:hypothetical protein
LSSWWVDDEIDRAFEKERLLMKERGEKVLVLVPLGLDGFLFKEWRSAKRRQVLSRKCVNFVGWRSNRPRLRNSITALLAALRIEPSE